MQIQYCSDLHLEFPENEKYLINNPLSVKGDILILAGDIVPFKIMGNYEDFFDYLSEKYKYTYWVPGNHEYYYYDISDKTGIINEKIRDNVLLVNNTTVKHGDVNMIFSTLWTKINLDNSFSIQSGMSDFHVIKDNKKAFTINKYNALYEAGVDFITDEIKNIKGKTIVVTHHVPTFYNYPKKYKGSVLNSAFAVELFDLIEKSNIDYWIYGHSHYNTKDFNIGKTKMLTNQLGYVQYGEHSLFSGNKFIKF